MPTLDAAQRIAVQLTKVATIADIDDALREVCRTIGCSFFALSHHVDFLAAPKRGIRIHNYPEEWALWFDERRLGLSDPVHRASQRRLSGFLWHDRSAFTPERPQDADILAQARSHGIGDGLTVPTHLPGEAHGSVSFAWGIGEPAPPEALYFAQMIGSHAFEAARLLANPEIMPRRPRLTDRQRECLIWSASGKSDWSISQILGLSRDTVKEHLRNARAKYDATDRTTLTTRALFGGDISFGDLAGR
ncbi:LuxR family transcriptional regulator [Sphingopyxis sp. KK2]|uniref:LuxR family transcriptional regulator n=1 Tax=Sphingopyxis sp. KK2 TaxID=1855727 RepID=UPI0009FA0DBF|nr:LuxR family transcriptional regulator [Sphingopyxis sp. KK2]